MKKASDKVYYTQWQHKCNSALFGNPHVLDQILECVCSEMHPSQSYSRMGFHFFFLKITHSKFETRKAVSQKSRIKYWSLGYLVNRNDFINRCQISKDNSVFSLSPQGAIKRAFFFIEVHSRNFFYKQVRMFLIGIRLLRSI